MTNANDVQRYTSEDGWIHETSKDSNLPMDHEDGAWKEYYYPPDSPDYRTDWIVGRKFLGVRYHVIPCDEKMSARLKRKKPTFKKLEKAKMICMTFNRLAISVE